MGCGVGIRFKEENNFGSFFSFIFFLFFNATKNDKKAISTILRHWKEALKNGPNNFSYIETGCEICKQ